MLYDAESSKSHTKGRSSLLVEVDSCSVGMALGSRRHDQAHDSMRVRPQSLFHLERGHSCKGSLRPEMLSAVNRSVIRGISSTRG